MAAGAMSSPMEIPMEAIAVEALPVALDASGSAELMDALPVAIATTAVEAAGESLGGGFAEDDEDAPDWLNQAAEDVGVAPVGPELPKAAALPEAPVIEVVAADLETAGAEWGVHLVASTLEACKALTASHALCYTRTTRDSVVQRPPAELMCEVCALVAGMAPPTVNGATADAFAGSAGGAMFERAEGGDTYLPVRDATGEAALLRFELLGRLLGYAMIHGLHVPLPLHASAFSFLTHGGGGGGDGGGVGGAAPPPPADVDAAIALLGGYDGRAAFSLRCELARRRSAMVGGGGGGGGGRSKSARAIAQVSEALYGQRLAALTALRDGVAALVGASVLASLRPEEAAGRLLGWERPMADFIDAVTDDDEADAAEDDGSASRLDVHARCRLVFDGADWEDDQLCDAYRTWFSAWARGIGPAERVAFLLRTFGAAVGPALTRRTCALTSDAARATFLPEAGQIYLPVAGSAEELAQRMSASLCLGADGGAPHAPSTGADGGAAALIDL